MKIIWLILCVSGLTNNVNSQSGLTFDASQSFSSFKFSDSQGDKQNKEYSGIFCGAYGIGYRINMEKGLIINSGIGMRKGGATLEYDEMNYSWNLQYVFGKIGVGYMLKKEKISPYCILNGYYAYLIKGFQIINNEEFDIRKAESLKNTDYGVYLTPGVQFTLSEEVSAYIEAGYLMGLQNIEKDESQKATNFSYSMTIGLSFTFTK